MSVPDLALDDDESEAIRGVSRIGNYCSCQDCPGSRFWLVLTHLVNSFIITPFKTREAAIAV